MNDYLLRRLNITKALNDYLPLVIEAFVEFYGEEERADIEMKLNNTILIGSQTPKNIERIIADLKDDYSKKLYNEICDKLNVTDKDYFIKKYFANYSLQYFNLLPIYNYFSYKELYDLGNEETNNLELLSGANDFNNNYSENMKYIKIKDKAVKYLKEYYPNINIDNIDNYEKNGHLKEFQVIYFELKKAIEKFDNEARKLEPYLEYSKKSKILAEQINKKYLKKLVDDFKDYLPEDEVEIYLENSQNIYRCKFIEKFIGHYISSDSCIECFDHKNEKIINEQNNSWKKQSIIRERISFFKLKGLDLGDDYESYINDERAKRLIPSQDLIDRVRNKKNEYDTLYQNEYYTSIQEFVNNRSLIDSHNLLCKDDGYDASIFIHPYNFISPNIKFVEDQAVVFPLVNIKGDSMLDMADDFLVHELNHVYELSLLSINDNNTVSFICGWDYLDVNINNSLKLVSLEEDHSKREYELISEIINELIAQEITTILHKKGIYIFIPKEKARIKGGTSYENTLSLVEDFFKEFKDDIIKSRKNNNVEYLFEVIGKDNFDEFNKLFLIFNEHFSGFSFHQLVIDLKKNVENENTKIYKELMINKDIILEKMINHKLEFYNSEALSA